MQVNEARKSQQITPQIFLTQVVSEDITEYMSRFLLRATRLQQFHFGNVQLKLAGPLLERLLGLLQDPVLSKDWSNYPFYIGMLISVLTFKTLIYIYIYIYFYYA
jgi:hypothetical protein